jgi:chromosome segregation ATPase
MKLFKILLVIIIFTQIACNNKELKESISTNDSMLEVNNNQDTLLISFVKAFNHVEEQLDSITKKQHNITKLTNNGDINENQKQRIDDNISDINRLMISNRKNLALLASKVKSTNLKNSALLKSIDIINRQLLEKDIELDGLNKELMFLNSELAQLKTKVNFLVSENEQQASTIKEKISENQTAYYIVDSKKNLEKNNILEVGSGFLGMNKTIKMNTNIENGLFNMIDYTLVSVIPIDADNINIITAHPGDSYTLYKDEVGKYKITSLIITSPERFWSTSKYLVIINDN